MTLLGAVQLVGTRAAAPGAPPARYYPLRRPDRRGRFVRGHPPPAGGYGRRQTQSHGGDGWRTTHAPQSSSRTTRVPLISCRRCSVRQASSPRRPRPASRRGVVVRRARYLDVSLPYLTGSRWAAHPSDLRHLHRDAHRAHRRDRHPHGPGRRCRRLPQRARAPPRELRARIEALLRRPRRGLRDAARPAPVDHEPTLVGSDGARGRPAPHRHGRRRGRPPHAQRVRPAGSARGGGSRRQPQRALSPAPRARSTMRTYVTDGDRRSVEVHIANLRRTLGPVVAPVDPHRARRRLPVRPHGDRRRAAGREQQRHLVARAARGGRSVASARASSAVVRCPARCRSSTAEAASPTSAAPTMSDVDRTVSSVAAPGERDRRRVRPAGRRGPGTRRRSA